MFYYNTCLNLPKTLKLANWYVLIQRFTLAVLSYFFLLFTLFWKIITKFTPFWMMITKFTTNIQKSEQFKEKY